MAWVPAGSRRKIAKWCDEQCLDDLVTYISEEDSGMDGYTVSVVFEASSDKVEEMEQVVKDVYLPSIRESGMREYRWYRSRQDPRTFLLFMTWDSEAHVNTPHIQQAEADFVSKGILVKPAPESYWQYLKP
ncbi:putative quinol monooxygenase [Microbulbifer sp. JSM ZJ756]|uniref:putative quinol monooxygenase n=1 Tax=Microbulbifer sp. JSM ZJ756 TaxID=3376191 RepID=UPI0037B84EA0